jgi:hypothetical protein
MSARWLAGFLMKGTGNVQQTLMILGAWSSSPACARSPCASAAAAVEAAAIGTAGSIRSIMKIIVIGHGMVGHKFLESLAERGAAPHLQVTVLCEEPRPAYDRVHLSEFFAGKSADDLSLVAPGFFERDNLLLR